MDISIFPNGRLYEMNGEFLRDEGEVLRVLYGLARDRSFSHNFKEYLKINMVKQ